jgi:hypothetical protein
MVTNHVGTTFGDHLPKLLNLFVGERFRLSNQLIKTALPMLLAFFFCHLLFVRRLLSEVKVPDSGTFSFRYGLLSIPKTWSVFADFDDVTVSDGSVWAALACPFPEQEPLFSRRVRQRVALSTSCWTMWTSRLQICLMAAPNPSMSALRDTFVEALVAHISSVCHGVWDCTDLECRR